MEEQIRTSAFIWLRKQVEIFGDAIPRRVLENGFVFQNERITVIGPSGIWKPRQFESKPISITSIINGPYEDVISEDGFLTYKYRGLNPSHRDNLGLRKAMEDQTPLIYFVSLSPGRYMANFPAYIIGDNPNQLEFRVALDEEKYIIQSPDNKQFSDPAEFYRRKYITTLVDQRVHQQSFRLRVLAAYNSQCCLCWLTHIELLDASHIIPDTEPNGHPIVTNGLPLCKIHHAAFDANIIGISPDYIIHIRKDILEEIDGPMLKHGIQELNKNRIILPLNHLDNPDRDRLDWRFERFRNAG